MSKSTLFAVFLILILGMIVKEIQGFGYCHKYLSETDCGAGSCNALCRQQFLDGTGKCLHLRDGRLGCLCFYSCGS
ncbi:unnamed protein product [Microthlaspi erraticum]|uniref:Knottin scorpion toxin-like domain-containing protein n=1 Tax=Microthlaspi erraticum TaxID=1685480 RepID=A0A6D2I199_9BRAS|nr:unnamed protein product [Microthlaspi erraticum]